MSPIQFNAQALNNQSDIRAHYEAAMNATGGIERGGSVASVTQGIRAKVMPQVRKHMINKRDIVIGVIFGLTVFGGACLLMVFGII